MLNKFTAARNIPLKKLLRFFTFKKPVLGFFWPLADTKKYIEKAQKIPTATFIKRAITSGWLNKNLEIKTATYA